MTIELRDGKILVSRANMNRVFHRTKLPWQMLQAEGAVVLVMGPEGSPVRVPAGQHPPSEVVGIDLMEQKQRFLTDWLMKFVRTVPLPGEKARVKECVIRGLPPIVVRPDRQR